MELIIKVLIATLILIFVFYLISNIYCRNKMETDIMMRISKDYEYDNKSSITRGISGSGKTLVKHNITNKIKVPDYFPQVGVLTNKILQTTPIEKFVWLEKTDGLHCNLIIFDNILYVANKQKIDKSLSQKRKVDKCLICGNMELDKIEDLPIKSTGQTVLDTELYKGKYYVFDASMIEDEDISNLGFVDRMKKAEDFITKHKISNIEIKKFESVKSIKELVEFINTNEISPMTGNEIDGVILQRIDLPYFNKTSTCFKLKRKVMNTIDFKLYYEKSENVFYLYLYGSYIDVIRNRKKLPRINKYSKKHTGIDLNSGKLPNKLYVLFCSPYQEGLHKFKPRSNWNTNGYFDSNIKQINELMNEMIKNPDSFNNSIIEMSLAEDGWVPMRKRNDKPFSNSYMVGLSNSSVIFNPVGESTESYFSKKLAFGEDITVPYHEINKVLRKYIIERSINTLNRKITVLDLAGGRGADELNLYHSGAYSIFAADADRDALVQYVERTTNTVNLNHDFLLKESKNINGMPKSILINAIYAFLNEDNSSIIKDIKSRFEFPKEGFDVILMNYAIHYLCYKKRCISALKDLINSLLKPDGIFVFSCFDGDSILASMDENKELKLKSFNIKLIEPELESDRDAVWAKMPLPTIDESGYRSEPLVLSEYLNLLNMKTIDHYYPMEECNTSNINNYHLVDDYLNYIHVHVMQRI